jgi:hypothetical protein
MARASNYRVYNRRCHRRSALIAKRAALAHNGSANPQTGQKKLSTMGSSLLFASCCLVSFCGCVSGLSAVIDTSERLPFVHNWKKCVGSGHMLLGTRADWRSHLLLAKNELGFVGVRGHGLLDDDMSVVPSKAALPEFYNVDQVMSGGHPSRWSADGGLHPTRSGDGLPDLEWNQAGC